MRRRHLAVLTACFLWAAPRAQGGSALQQLRGIAPPGTFSPDIDLRPGAALATMDVTREYLAAWWNDNPFGTAQIEELKHCKVLIVPGFLGNHYHGYFTDQMNWLWAIGVSYEKVGINTEQTPRFNARIIAQAIASSDRPVIIISHSKGSLDVLETLLSHRELVGKVKGWVSLQGALLGSPVADFVVHSSRLDSLASKFLKKLGGTRESLVSLTTTEAQRHYQQNAASITEILGRVPTVAFASWKDSQPRRINSLLELPRDWMERQGIRSDGLVPPANAVLPGMGCVMVPGIDHADTVLSRFSNIDRVRLTKALLAVLLRRMS